MKRVDAIWTNPVYQKYYKRLEQFEEKRSFCRHDINHFLDVARIAYIMDLEQHLDVSKELIYATALLHDIGRIIQYEHGTPHEKAGMAVAGEVLAALPAVLRFTEDETNLILQAISTHRHTSASAEPQALTQLIRRADHISRPCYQCPVKAECNWPVEKLNTGIHI